MFRQVNPSYRKGNGGRGGAREGVVPGAGVGPCSGGNRVRGCWRCSEGTRQNADGFDPGSGLKTLLGQGAVGRRWWI